MKCFYPQRGRENIIFFSENGIFMVEIKVRFIISNEFSVITVL